MDKQKNQVPLPAPRTIPVGVKQDHNGMVEKPTKDFAPPYRVKKLVRHSLLGEARRLAGGLQFFSHKASFLKSVIFLERPDAGSGFAISDHFVGVNKMINLPKGGDHMNMIPVSSSNLASVGYENGILHVRFRSGWTYAYSNVPASVYQGLMSAPSKGKYFNAYIGRRYGEHRIG